MLDPNPIPWDLSEEDIEVKAQFPHDNLFALLFSSRRHLLAFFEAFLPDCLEPLDPDSASLVNPKLVDEALSARVSDILWAFQSAHEDPVRSSRRPSHFLLLEHKSHPDHDAILQMLGLMLRIWDRYGSRVHILPVLLTNTPRPWPDPLDLRSLLPESPWHPRHVPSFEPVHISLTELDPAQLGPLWDLRAGIRLMAMAARGEMDERLAIVFREAARGSWTQGDERLVRALLAYVTRGKMRLSVQELGRVVGQTLGAQGEDIMESFAEYWMQQGRKKGLEEGRRKGVEEGRRKGVEEGRRKGIEEGIRRLADSVCQVLRARFGSVPLEVEAFVRTRTDLDELTDLHRRALQVEAPEEILDL